MLYLLVFNSVYILEIQSVMLTYPPSLCEKAQGHVFKQSVTEGRGPQTDKNLPPNPFTGKFLRKGDL
jgi:hypothetical protein